MKQLSHGSESSCGKGVYNMVRNIGLSLLIAVLSIRCSVEAKPQHPVVTLVRSRNNKTFEILIQHHECPEGYFLRRLSPGELYLDDGRDAIEKVTELCRKCTMCDDGVQIKRECTQYSDVLCTRKCQEPDHRFDEGTQSCQPVKVLDEGFTHAEYRQWKAAQEQKARENMVAEVGSTVKSGLGRTARALHDITSARVAVEQTAPALPMKATVDEKDDLLRDVSTVETVREGPGGIREVVPEEAGTDEGLAFQHLLLIASASLLALVLMAYACVAIKKFQPRFFFRRRDYMRPTSVPVIRAEAGISSDVPTTSMVHVISNPIANYRLIVNGGSRASSVCTTDESDEDTPLLSDDIDSFIDTEDENNDVIIELEQNQEEAVMEAGEQIDDNGRENLVVTVVHTTCENADCVEISTAAGMHESKDNLCCNDRDHKDRLQEEVDEFKNPKGAGNSLVVVKDRNSTRAPGRYRVLETIPETIAISGFADDLKLDKADRGNERDPLSGEDDEKRKEGSGFSPSNVAKSAHVAVVFEEKADDDENDEDDDDDKDNMIIMGNGDELDHVAFADGDDAGDEDDDDDICGHDGDAESQYLAVGTDNKIDVKDIRVGVADSDSEVYEDDGGDDGYDGDYEDDNDVSIMKQEVEEWSKEGEDEEVKRGEDGNDLISYQRIATNWNRHFVEYKHIAPKECKIGDFCEEISEDSGIDQMKDLKFPDVRFESTVGRLTLIRRLVREFDGCGDIFMDVISHCTSVKIDQSYPFPTYKRRDDGHDIFAQGDVLVKRWVNDPLKDMIMIGQPAQHHERTRSLIFVTAWCDKLLPRSVTRKSLIISNVEIGLTSTPLSSEDFAGPRCGPGFPHLLKRLLRECRCSFKGQLNLRQFVEQLLMCRIIRNSSSREEKLTRKAAKKTSSKESEALNCELSLLIPGSFGLSYSEG